jgi:hypothetical protein
MGGGAKSGAMSGLSSFTLRTPVSLSDGYKARQTRVFFPALPLIFLSEFWAKKVASHYQRTIYLKVS